MSTKTHDVTDAVPMTVYDVVGHDGQYEVEFRKSVSGEPLPFGVLHVFVDRDKAYTKAAELNAAAVAEVVPEPVMGAV